MRPSKAKLLRHILPILREQGLNWEELVSHSQEIILFGSTVLGRNRKGSDVDILCIGKGKRIKNRVLDIMWRQPERLNVSSWLGSELAGHIAAFGVWLHGKGEWAANVVSSEASINFKRKLIASRARCLFSDWNVLREEYRQKHVVKLRRDLQRLQILENANPVPPTPVLDTIWAKQKSPSAIHELVKSTGSRGIVTARHLRRFSPYFQRRFESGTR